MALGGAYGIDEENLDEYRTPIALEHILNSYPTIKHIVLHLDNDRVGRCATKSIKYKLHDYIVIDEPPKLGKDVNDETCIRLSIPITKRKNIIKKQKEK